MASKLMLLTVYGVTPSHSIGSWQRLVSVNDEVEFLGTMRALALKELVDEIGKGNVSDEDQAAILRALRLKLTDTGLKDMPETDEERNALWLRMTNGAPKEEPVLT